ncbi:hypothetical protein HDU92_006695, partial [Lobulomyces angularis]
MPDEMELPPPWMKTRLHITIGVGYGIILGTCLTLMVFVLTKFNYTKLTYINLLSLSAYIVSTSALASLDGLFEDFRVYNQTIGIIFNGIGRELMTQFYILLTKTLVNETRRKALTITGRLSWVILIAAAVLEGAVLNINEAMINEFTRNFITASATAALVCGLINAVQFIDMILAIGDANANILQRLKDPNFRQLFLLSCMVLALEIVVSTIGLVGVIRPFPDPLVSYFFLQLMIIVSSLGLVLLQENIVK